jgi:hypothetical protein
MRKGVTSHKQLTSILAANSIGNMLRLHNLLSGEKSSPEVPNSILLNLNMSEIWNDETILDYVNKVILSKGNSFLS